MEGLWRVLISSKRDAKNICISEDQRIWLKDVCVTVKNVIKGAVVAWWLAPAPIYRGSVLDAADPGSNPA